MAVECNLNNVTKTPIFLPRHMAERLAGNAKIAVMQPLDLFTSISSRLDKQVMQLGWCG